MPNIPLHRRHSSRFAAIRSSADPAQRSPAPPCTFAGLGYVTGGVAARAITRLMVAVALLSMLGSQPARAHVTDPPHSLWMVGFRSDFAHKVGPGESLRLDAWSRFTPPTPLPPTGYAVLRTYELVLPERFNVTYADIVGFWCQIECGECRIQSNVVQCTAVSALFGDLADGLIIEATTVQQEGDYQATLTMSAGWGGEDTDSDSLTIHLVPRREVDLAWTQTPGTGLQGIEAGEPQTLTYAFTNHGPQEARDVRAGFFQLPLPYPLFAITSVSPAEPTCRCEPLSSCECFWDAIAAGETVTITLTGIQDPVPQVETLFVPFWAFIQSYDYDADSSNDYAREDIPVHCSSYIHPSASVDPTAKIEDAGCTYVGRDAVIRAHAKLGNGAWVDSGSVVGEHARMLAGSILLTAGAFSGRHSTIEAHGIIGKYSIVVGDVGEHAKLGTDVQGTGGWVIVEPRVKIGSRSRILFPRPWEQQSVRILEGAAVPADTVIDEAYCQQRPDICRFY